MKTAPKSQPKTDVAAAFGVDDKPFLFYGQPTELRFLSFNDLKEMQIRFGSIDDLDPTDLEQAGFMVYLCLRKSDPRLTPDQRRSRQWLIDEHEAGEIVGIGAFASLYKRILIGSGLAEAETDQGNAPADAR